MQFTVNDLIKNKEDKFTCDTIGKVFQKTRDPITY